MLDKTSPTFNAAASSGGEQVAGVLHRSVSRKGGCLEPTVGSVVGIGLMMQAAVGEGRTAVCERTGIEEGDLNAFSGEASGAASSGGEQIDDLLDRSISTVVGRLEPTVGPVLGIGLMMEAAVGEGAAQPFVKEQE